MKDLLVQVRKRTQGIPEDTAYLFRAYDGGFLKAARQIFLEDRSRRMIVRD